jgi:hypothetical protein
MREISGWWMEKVFFLTDEPMNEGDIVSEITCLVEAPGSDEDVYQDKKEALLRARKILVER